MFIPSKRTHGRNRFKSRQKLDNFKVTIGDPRVRKQAPQDDTHNSSHGVHSQSTSESSSPPFIITCKENSSRSLSKGLNPGERLDSGCSDGPTSILDNYRGDPFWALPITSRHVNLL